MYGSKQVDSLDSEVRPQILQQLRTTLCTCYNNANVYTLTNWRTSNTAS